MSNFQAKRLSSGSRNQCSTAQDILGSNVATQSPFYISSLLFLTPALRAQNCIEISSVPCEFMLKGYVEFFFLLKLYHLKFQFLDL